MEVNVCIPVLNRYDLLVKCIHSAERGAVKPERYWIYDNGNKFNLEDYKDIAEKITIFSPGLNRGTAKSWNWFINNIPEFRVVCNDDVEFYEDTIEILLAAYTQDAVIYPAGVPSANSFSCYVLPDKVVELVGLFDEMISPNYAYFEDNDYHRRMIKEGIELRGIAGCRIDHSNSSTLQRFTSLERRRHHNNFSRARTNYVRKWGGTPGEEKFDTPYNI